MGARWVSVSPKQVAEKMLPVFGGFGPLFNTYWVCFGGIMGDLLSQKQVHICALALVIMVTSLTVLRLEVAC